MSPLERSLILILIRIVSCLFRYYLFLLFVFFVSFSFFLKWCSSKIHSIVDPRWLRENESFNVARRWVKGKGLFLWHQHCLWLLDRKTRHRCSSSKIVKLKDLSSRIFNFSRVRPYCFETDLSLWNIYLLTFIYTYVRIARINYSFFKIFFFWVFGSNWVIEIDRSSTNRSLIFFIIFL